ncbi:hypothetical protein I4U23_011498 [Adineta vaga]|nr:hypothetical protein I4U23_011498 [Adineta vaga]
MDNITVDQPTTSFSIGYVRLPNEDNPINRNYVVVTYKQILATLLSVLTVIVLLLVVIIIVLLKTYTQTTYITYNTTTNKFVSKTQMVISSSCPIPMMNAEWNQESIILVNSSVRCLSNGSGLCGAHELFVDNLHDNLYVVNTKNNRIRKYSLTQSFDPHQGAFEVTVASKGLIQPQSIFVDTQTEDMYILDY